ncbi:restriction endonuclease [Streptomyces sp. CC219B]|uniref:restriction endonuclease n=1 Tax=Streptomyces sp. CC219B TaxID=3044574 RepID=UPI0024A83739|nr:restriction endonuclease [Streptomyces sp. CC219B]
MSAPARRRAQQSDPVGCAYALAALIAGSIALVMAADGLGAAALLPVFLFAVGVAVHARYRIRQAAEQRQLQAIQSTEIARYHAMNPREFEQAIAYLCERDGCTDARVVGGAGDLGADVLATAPDGRRIVIQCKRYGPTTKVSSPDLQRFGGTCYSVHGAQIAVVVTTSVFTRPAANYGAQHGILLFDEAALAAWATRTGLAPWM